MLALSCALVLSSSSIAVETPVLSREQPQKIKGDIMSSRSCYFLHSPHLCIALCMHQQTCVDARALVCARLEFVLHCCRDTCVEQRTTTEDQRGHHELSFVLLFTLPTLVYRSVHASTDLRRCSRSRVRSS